MAGTIFVVVFLLLLLGIILGGVVLLLRDTPARRAKERPAVVKRLAEREVELEDAKARIREGRDEEAF
ncbi:hypothetical protein ABC270_13295 [Curtobacterium sp. 1P10AnD]|uniref:hypothetical protein n=1 Tax=Curtobacterium sp. 1P10AnD TaxID=3132283 RepID=UPI0039A0CC61